MRCGQRYCRRCCCRALLPSFGLLFLFPPLGCRPAASTISSRVRHSSHVNACLRCITKHGGVRICCQAGDRDGISRATAASARHLAPLPLFACRRRSQQIGTCRFLGDIAIHHHCAIHFDGLEAPMRVRPSNHALRIDGQDPCLLQLLGGGIGFCWLIAGQCDSSYSLHGLEHGLLVQDGLQLLWRGGVRGGGCRRWGKQPVDHGERGFARVHPPCDSLL